MEKIDYEKEFLSIYNKFNQKYSKWEVWKDFYIFRPHLWRIR